MQSARVLWQDGSITPVMLNPPVTALNSQVEDLGKTQETYTKLLKYYPQMTGAVKARNGSIAFSGSKNQGEFIATIFPGRQKIRGTYKGV